MEETTGPHRLTNKNIKKLGRKLQWGRSSFGVGIIMRMQIIQLIIIIVIIITIILIILIVILLQSNTTI